MKNKWIIILILFGIILINPSKNGNILNFKKNNNIKIEDIKKIDINSNYKSIDYDGKVVYHDGNQLKGIDNKGENIFELNIKTDNYYLDSNKYIDILDKENNICYSINKNGKIIFKKSVPKKGIMYKSFNDDLYVYSYKKGEKDRCIIYDNEYNLINDLALDGLVIDIEYIDNYIYIASINTEKNLSSKIEKYDINGNLKNSVEVNDSIILDLKFSKDSLITIYNNRINEINNNLETENSVDTGIIKSYSNELDGGLYIIEDNNSIKYIKDKKKNVITDMENPIGIVNKEDKSILYNKNYISTIKNKKIKEYKEDILKITPVTDNIYSINFKNSIEIVEIK